MRLRSRRRKPAIQLDETPPGESGRPAAQVADRAPSPEELYSRDEIRAQVRREVAALPALLRDALMLRDFEELPIEAVADRLRVSIPAAKSRLLRARAELRRRLDRHSTPLTQ